MKVIILDDYKSVSEYAARLIAERICAYESGNPSSQNFVLGLPTGSTPLGTYKRLIEMHRRGEVSFRRVTTFNMDEYVGLPVDHPQSYHSFMYDHFFRQIDIDAANVHIPDGNANNLAEACASYERMIVGAGGIDLFLGGIGSDGHVAFNEPGTSLVSRTHVQPLNRETIVANARFFNNDRTQVPRRAVTVGVGTIMDAREVLILASGESKAAAVKQVVEGAVSHMWTATAFQQHANTTLVVDDAATGDLMVKTVRFFRDAYADEIDALACNKSSCN